MGQVSLFDSRRRVALAEATFGEVARQGARTLTLRCDVTGQADAADVVERTIEELGRLDVVVNASYESTRATCSSSTAATRRTGLWLP